MPPAEYRKTEEEFPGAEDEPAEDEDDEDSSDDAADIVGSVISSDHSNTNDNLVNQMSQIEIDEEEEKVPNSKAIGRASIARNDPSKAIETATKAIEKHNDVMADMCRESTMMFTRPDAV